MKNKQSQYIRGIICALAGGISWGFSGACGQILVTQSQIDSSWVTAMRMFFAGIILTIINILKNKGKSFEVLKNKNDVLRLVLFSIFGLIFSQFTYLKAISYSNAGTATVLQYIGPVFIMIYVCIISKKLPKKSELVSVLLAFLGVAVLATHGDFTSLKLSKECLFWGILSAVSLMLYTLMPVKLIEKYSAVPIAGYGMLIGGIIMMIAVRPWEMGVQLNQMAIFALLGMIIVGTVIAYTLYLQGVSVIGSVRASMIACVEPVSATLFSFFWLKTSFEFIDVLGFVMILSAVFILSSSKDKK